MYIDRDLGRAPAAAICDNAELAIGISRKRHDRLGAALAHQTERTARAEIGRACDNAAIGEAVKLYDCARNVIHAHDGRLMVLQGLEDHIVVSTKDALLVCRKQDEQRIKQFVNDLTAESGDRYV